MFEIIYFSNFRPLWKHIFPPMTRKTSYVMLRKFLILIMSLLLLAQFCMLTEQTPTTKKNIITHNFNVEIDSSFSQKETSIIKLAGHRWELATKNIIHFTFSNKKMNYHFNPSLELIEFTINNSKIDENNKIFLWNASSSDQRFMELENLIRIRIVGLMSGSYILLVPDRMDTLKDLERTTVHEFGHLIGLAHTRSIMNASDEDTFCITNVDMAQFCNIYKCDVKDISFECQ